MPNLPTVPKMSYCIIWSTMWWCVATPLYLILFAPNFATVKTTLASPLLVSSSLLLGLVLGVLSGILDWWWNRKPYYSQLKHRWFNQAGTGSILGGAAAGCMLGLTEWLPKITSWDGPYAGVIAGGLLGIVVGVVYKYSALYFRFIVEA